MIGVESPNNGKLFYNFNLEKKVRKNHPLRKLKETLNLGNHRGQVSMLDVVDKSKIRVR